MYKHTFLAVHIDAHPLSVLSGLRSCTGVFASDVYDTHSDYAFGASAHCSSDYFIACQQYLKFSGVFLACSALRILLSVLY